MKNDISKYTLDELREDRAASMLEFCTLVKLTSDTTRYEYEQKKHINALIIQTIDEQLTFRKVPIIEPEWVTPYLPKLKEYQIMTQTELMRNWMSKEATPSKILIDSTPSVFCDFCNCDGDSANHDGTACQLGGGMIGSNACCQNCYDKSATAYPNEAGERFDATKSFGDNVRAYRIRHYGTPANFSIFTGG